MRVVVTGAAGLTGTAIVAGLLRSGHQVSAVVRRPASMPSLQRLGAEVVVVDVHDRGRMTEVLRQAEGIIHGAGINLAGALLAAGVAPTQRLVVISTAAVYSRHRSSAAEYRRAEDLILSADPQAILVRPTMIYGSRRDRNVHRAIEFARRYRFLPLPGPGSSLIQPIHYQDLAEVVIRVISGSIAGFVDAGGGAALTVRSAAEQVFDALGQPRVILRLPLGAAVLAATALERSGKGRSVERLLRLSEDRSVDNGRLISATGIRPRSFACGVRGQVAEMYGLTAGA